MDLKERTGSIVKRDGELYVRITYRDNSGKRRELMRRAIDKADARQIQRHLVEELESENREQEDRRFPVDVPGIRAAL